MGYLERPPIRQLVVAVRHARESIEGSDRAIEVQAAALLRADGYTLADEDEATIAKLVANAPRP